MPDVEMKKVKQLTDGRIAIFDNNQEAPMVERGGLDPAYMPFQITLYKRDGVPDRFKTLESAAEFFEELI